MQSKIEGLSSEKRALLLKKLRDKSRVNSDVSEKNSSASVIPSVSRSCPLVLSFAQERLWFLNELEKPDASAVYNIPVAYRLSGELHIPLLEKALNLIIKRHEVLRTTFYQKGGQVYQRISESLFVPLVVQDVCCGSHNRDAITEAKRVASEFSQQPFDLSSGPLVRWGLLPLLQGKQNETELEYILIVSIHHIIFDGWSNGVIEGEVSALYGALVAGKVPSLLKLPIQYADYAAWQRERFSDGELLQKQLSYWKAKLKNSPQLLSLSCQKARPPEQSYKGSIAHFHIPLRIKSKLDALGLAVGATPFMTLLAAFSLLLHRYEGGDELVIGTPVSNRSRSELEPLIGFFVNTLALRIDLSSEPSFNTLVQRVKEVALEGYTHQDIPFEKLVKELAPKRDLSHAPLFQVMFVIHNAPSHRGDSEQILNVESFPLESHTAHFDLLMYLSEKEDGYYGMLEYASDLFDPQMIQEMLTHFELLLESIVKNPQQKISSYPAITDLQKQKILSEWSFQPEEFPFHTPVYQLFEKQAEQSPNTLAVVCGDKRLRYAELNEKANQLARSLSEKGVGSGSVVGLLMERSEILLVALLAVLKAGAGYLPLDLEYPEERIELMLKESKASCFICDQHFAEPASLIEDQEYQLIRIDTLDTLQRELNTYSVENLPRKTEEDSLAYILFTSGSTGKPKGVAMGHFALSNLIHWHLADVRLSSGVHTVQFAPFSFDVSFQEVFSTLCSGGTLHIASQTLRQDPVALLTYVESQKIERLFLPFVALQQFVSVAVEREEYPHCLKDIITAGEQLHISSALTAFFKVLPECRLHNHYGPSETHVVTTYTLSENVSEWELLPPIGKGIPNARIYILDSSQTPVPVGMVGELYVGGVSLAFGYLGNSADADRFGVNPFCNKGEGSHRLYKTGDLAMWQPDGNIKFLGRSDTQVKIRGYRIEPGEVEAVLNANESVAESAVIDVRYSDGDRRLVAYVVASSPKGFKIKELRLHLKKKLPEYMIPSVFVSLDALPLTSSGKLNRRLLPKSLSEDVSSVAPLQRLSAVEEVLVSLWCEVLKLQTVGVEDDFFELGGHSLLATQLVSRIREAFSIDIAVRQIFEAPTIRELAVDVEAFRDVGVCRLPPIVALEKQDEYPLSFAQERLWFLNRLEGEGCSYNMPAAVQIMGDLNEEALQRSISEIIRRHEVLRTHFRYHDGKPVAVVEPYTHRLLPVVDMQAYSLNQRNEAIDKQIAAEATKIFNLEEDPLFSGSLLKLQPFSEANKNEPNYILLLTMHHIVADNWSTGVFLHELMLLYDAYCTAEQHNEKGFVSPLAELEVQYSDYAQWQREWLQEEALQKQLDYWHNQLDGASVVLDLSQRRKENPNASFTYTRSFSLSSKVSSRFNRLCLEKGVSLYMGLLSLYGVLLFRYSGQEDFLVGSPVANRHYKEIEPLIGFFVNTLPLRMNLAGEPSYVDILKRVRKITLDAFSFQDIPFEEIVRAVCPDRAESRTPLIQVVFAFQNAPTPAGSLHGITMKPLPTPRGKAKFDLILSMSEYGGNLHGTFEYDSALFSPEEIAQMTDHFIRLVEEIITSPDKKILETSLNSVAEDAPVDEAEDFNF